MNPLPAGRERPNDESWFSALGLVHATGPASLDDEPPATPPPRPKARRRRFIRPNPPPLAPNTTERPAQARIYRAFAWARALLGMLMLITQGLVHAYGITHLSSTVIALCTTYAALAALALHTPRSLLVPPAQARPLRARWFMATVGVDLLCFGLLLLLVGRGLNSAALYALPVLMAASLAPRQVALGVAAVASLTMLGAAMWQAGEGDAATSLMQAGLAGAGLFAIATLTSELAARLAREERTARNTLALARQQALLNRLVIEEMQDGVLVVDRQGQIRAANPAALALIGAPVGPHPNRLRLRDRPAWRPLVQAIDQAYASGAWPDGGLDIHLLLESPEARTLRLRLRFTRKREPDFDEAMCVLFIEDVRTLRARVQQEKLAAMGRVSAGIAHEIRNPLAAITQANALLCEDLQDPALRRLACIVADNAVRLRRIVDDVMTAAPTGEGAGSHALIDLPTQLREITDDWLRTNNLPAGTIALRLPAHPLAVRFELDHLRRVMVNLLDNAWRHGSRQPGAVEVALEVVPRGMALTLTVGNDGAAITPDVERHLFEPFFSTAARGTGLGLYICRELCERYGARIEYRAGPPGARALVNRFIVTLPMPGTEPPRTPPSPR
jgi:two-component system sensor histidine kinase PilS (NtrC family)